jgi:hypothetical protein
MFQNIMESKGLKNSGLKITYYFSSKWQISSSGKAYVQVIKLKNLKIKTVIISFICP